MMRNSTILGCALWVGALVACSDDPDGPGGGTGGAGGDEAGLPEPVCTEGGSRWASGTAAFEEVTADWGLAGVEGIRINAVDFDGDGWTDLVVRRGANKPDDFTPPDPCCADDSCGASVECPTRYTFLMRNTGDGSFEDVTQSSGIMQKRLGGDPAIGRPGSVFAFGDVDNDGDLDAYVGRGPDADVDSEETSEILLNEGDGTFVLGPEGSGVRLLPDDNPAGAVFLDYDRNGLLDLFVAQNTNGSTPLQDRLLWGEGTGMMVDVTEGVGMTTESWSSIEDLNAGLAHSVAWAAVACDLNGDGFLEILASSYGRAPNHLWQAQGPLGMPMYANRSVESGYAFDHRTDWTDNESARCWCKLHPTDEDCSGVPEPELIPCMDDSDAFRWNHDTDREPFRLGGNSGATTCFDVDNDGHMDLLTSEIVHWDVGSSSDPSELLFNEGESDVTFERPGNEATGLTREHEMVAWNDGDITNAVFDFDNDGWPDVYIGSTDYPGTQGLLYHQDSARSFTKVPFDQGIDHNRSHGIGVADFDRDGDLDVIVGHSRARCSGADDCYPTAQVRMFENVMPRGNWVQLRLVGAAGTNRSAIGARVTVVGEDGVTQTQEVGGGYGHYGAQQDLVLHFGLGGACEADVTVRWPNADLTEETFHLGSGYRYVLRQGEKPALDPWGRDQRAQ